MSVKNTFKSERGVYTFETFKGVDYAHAPGNVSPQRSTDGLNMVRSEVGKVRKRIIQFVYISIPKTPLLR